MINNSIGLPGAERRMYCKAVVLTKKNDGELVQGGKIQ